MAEKACPEPAHIAFMAAPAHGHVNPGLGLVTELVERGHRVTYAISDEFAPQVATAGAAPVVYESTLPSENDPEEQWPEDAVTGTNMFLDELVAVLPQIEDAYDGDRPDLIVHDIAGWQAPILAAKWGVPCVQLSPTHVAFEGIEDDPHWAEVQQDPRMAEFHARFDEFLGNQGVEMTATDVMTPRRCIVTIPRSFQHRGDAVADSYTFVGPLLSERSSQGDWQAPDDRPVLLISLGSAYTDQLDFYRECVRAYADLDWHVVLSVGRFVDPADLGELPANFEVRQWVPQLRILSRADAFITHAGMGGTMEALYHGVPLIAVPQATDQFINAPRIAELGLGRHVPREEVTAEGLREALLSVCSDEDVRARLDEMRREIHESGGLGRAVEILEEHL
ncbi:MGT family glycosyltransferase [Saccharopolyspora lacisalsi]|uniref:MGT family glycosyltransferase n=1 Tax=Halosaccharopolyspora lacisalsi TaxID=1000566 RepID=A0A839E1B6_9PSEU|nr:macrolide family glycosyltransferase [Halosaccharopolyspora lacisalsi]MBA8826880.1 MGT family glycosyltransferase [Halosaccharopolyspora lacisalsi]